MVFTFPANFNFYDMLGFARQGRFAPASFRGQCELDLSQLEFAGPGPMACIKAMLAREQRLLPPEGCFIVRHRCQDAIRYLSRMDFFSDEIRWCIPPEQETFIRRSAAGRFCPIRNLHQLNQTNTVSRELAACLAADQQSQQTIQYAISELIDNALQHSGSPTGAFATAQKYEKWVHALIVDTGIGIRQHLMRHPRFRDVGSDEAAIRAALTPFVTGTFVACKEDDHRDYQNQGLGLSVINELAKRSSGGLNIWSGRALYSSTTGGFEELPEWAGTIVFLNLPVQLQVKPNEIVRSFDTLRKKHEIKLNFNV